MFKFENGTLEKGAYVEINGHQYPVVMPKFSGKTPLSAVNLNNMQIELLKDIFPIGSKYVTEDNTNPTEKLGFGVWERFNGKIAIGYDEYEEKFNQIGKTGGEIEHTLTVAEIPPHDHKTAINFGGNEQLDSYSSYTNNNQGRYYNITSKAGGGKAHNNMPPYEVVGFMWIRRR